MAQHAEPALRRSLATLQDPPLPDGLWPRVARARARQLERRRLALGGAAAVAFAALALPLALVDRGVPPDAGGRQARTASAQPPRATADHDATARLRSLDRELQAAYRQGSDDAGIAQLWAARAALLRDRDRDRDRATPVRPVRI